MTTELNSYKKKLWNFMYDESFSTKEYCIYQYVINT